MDHSKLMLKDKVIVVASIALLVLFVVAFAGGTVFFGLSGFFKLVGVTYTSGASLILFILFCFVLSSILSFFEIAFTVLFSLFGLRNRQLFLLVSTIDITFSWITIHTVDECMKSITISPSIEVFLVVLLFCMDLLFDKKTEGN
jgi:hypothetical protein